MDTTTNESGNGQERRRRVWKLAPEVLARRSEAAAARRQNKAQGWSRPQMVTELERQVKEMAELEALRKAKLERIEELRGALREFLASTEIASD